jgi:ZIP family zinc transporter
MITREIIIGLMIPFIGTSAGGACVFFMKRGLDINVQKALTGFAAAVIVPAMPYLLSFAAGAMIYVVVEELIPEMAEGEHSHIGVLLFAAGFTVMMALDVALG